MLGEALSKSKKVSAANPHQGRRTDKLRPTHRTSSGQGGHAENTGVNTGGQLHPQPHGGALRAGNPGNRGGTGRPPNALREQGRAGLEEGLPLLCAIAAGTFRRVGECPHCGEIVLQAQPTVKETAGAPDPAIEPFLKKPLVVNGLVVSEMTNKRALKRIALTACKNHMPVIYWSPRVKLEASPYSMVFFRLHEAAHLELGHVSCDASGSPVDYPQAPNQESGADCVAARGLAASRTGDRIIGSAYERLWAMNRAGDSRYPPSKERDERLVHDCSQPGGNSLEAAP